MRAYRNYSFCTVRNSEAVRPVYQEGLIISTENFKKDEMCILWNLAHPLVMITLIPMSSLVGLEGLC